MGEWHGGLGNCVGRVLYQRGLTDDELAARVGLSRAQLNRIRNGRAAVPGQGSLPSGQAAVPAPTEDDSPHIELIRFHPLPLPVPMPSPSNTLNLVNLVNPVSCSLRHEASWYEHGS
jgi:hypothetical protein